MAAFDLEEEVTGEGEPLLILHGLFGSGRNWGLIARKLADIRRVHALDLRNHGSSPWSSEMTYPVMAEDVALTMDALGIEAADILGHSMGGKAAMALALAHPEMVRRLIVVDIAPVSYKRDAYPGFIQAMRAARIDGATRRAEVEADLAPAVADPMLRSFLTQNLVRTETGFAWRLNLDALARTLDDIVGWPDLEGRFDGPVTVLVGEKSNYVRPRDEAAFRRLFPNAVFAEIGDAGHWAHAEQPERFVALVRKALA